MNTGVGKLHQMLFYAGLEPEEYQACLPEIRKDNRKKLRAYLIIAGIFLLVIICLLGGLGALRANRGYYLLSFVGCLVLLAIEMMLPEDNGLLLDWLMYAFEAQLYLLGMLIMKDSPADHEGLAGGAFGLFHRISAGRTASVRDAAGAAYQQHPVLCGDLHRAGAAR